MTANSDSSLRVQSRARKPRTPVPRAVLDQRRLTNAKRQLEANVPMSAASAALALGLSPGFVRAMLRPVMPVTGPHQKPKWLASAIVAAVRRGQSVQSSEVQP